MVAGLVSAAAGSSGGVYPKLFVGTSVLTAVVALSLALTIRESRPALKEPVIGDGSPLRIRPVLSDGPFLVLLGVGVLLYYIFTQDWQALPVYAKNFVGVADGQIGFFLGANGLMVILFQLPVSYLIDRGSRIVALLAGAALFGACFGVACGFSPIVAGTLLGAGVPGVIWVIQLATAGLAAVGLVALLRRSVADA